MRQRATASRARAAPPLPTALTGEVSAEPPLGVYRRAPSAPRCRPIVLTSFIFSTKKCFKLNDCGFSRSSLSLSFVLLPLFSPSHFKTKSFSSPERVFNLHSEKSCFEAGAFFFSASFCLLWCCCFFVPPPPPPLAQEKTEALQS